MQQTSMRRLAAICLAGLTLSACQRDVDREAARHETARGLMDEPGGALYTATGVAAIMSDGNVFAVVDTTLSKLVESELLAQERATDPAIRQYAGGAVTQHATMRSQVKALSDRLRIPPVLPDRSEIEDHRARMDEMRQAQGAQFDQLFLRHVTEQHEMLNRELDRAIGSARVPEVDQFLRELKANVDADLEQLRQLSDRR